MPDTPLSNSLESPRRILGESLPLPSATTSLLGRILNLPTLELSQLPSAERLRLQTVWGAYLDDLLSLRGETDTPSLLNALLRMGRSLEDEERDSQALAVYQAIQDFEERGQGRSFGQEAQGRIRAMTGIGAASFDPDRLRFLAARMTRQIVSPTGILTLSAASLAFRLTRFCTLSHLALTPAESLLTRGLGARLLAQLAGMAVEAPTFTLSNHLLSGAPEGGEGEAAAFGRELLSNFLVIGGMRLSAALAEGFVTGLHGIDPATGRVARLQGFHRFTRQAFGHAGMLGGILLGHRLETWAGLREASSTADLLSESLGLFIQYHLAGRVAQGAMGEGFSALEQEIESRTLRLETRPTRFPFDPSSLWPLAVTPEGTVFPAAESGDRDLFPNIQMMENNGKGRSFPPANPEGLEATVQSFILGNPSSERVQTEPPPQILMEEGLAGPIYVQGSENLPPQYLDSLKALLLGQEETSPVPGHLASLWRGSSTLREFFQGFHPERPRSLSLQLGEDGGIQHAVFFGKTHPERAVLMHEARLQQSGSESRLAYDLVFPESDRSSPETTVYRWHKDAFEPLRRGESQARLHAEGFWELFPRTPAALRVQRWSLGRQGALEIQSREGNPLLLWTPEQVSETPGSRLLTLLDLLGSTGLSPSVRAHLESQRETMIRQLSALPQDHPTRRSVIQELGSTPRSVIASLLHLMAGERPRPERALLGEIMATREISGFSQRHQILEYKELEPFLRQSEETPKDPVPSGVRFLESQRGETPVERLMIRSRAAGSLNPFRTLEEAVLQLRSLVEAHPRSEGNVIQIVIRRSEQFKDDDNYREFLLSAVQETAGAVAQELRLKRVTFILDRESGYPNYLTFRPRLNGEGSRTEAWEEDTRYRDLHPMLAHFIELKRLDNFDLERDLGHSDRFHHLYFAQNKAEGRLRAGEDQRLFGLTLVPEAEVLRPSDGTLREIPEVERAFVETAQRMQEALDAKGGVRPLWNRIFLNIQPILRVSDAEVLNYAQELAERHRERLPDLGLEKVVVKARIQDERMSEGYRTVLVRISNPTAYRFETTLHNIVQAQVSEGSGNTALREVLLKNGAFERFLADPARALSSEEAGAPADVPIRPATPAEIREQQARARGAVWAYRIPALFNHVAETLRTRWGLGSTRSGRSVLDGEASTYLSHFIELELDPASRRVDRKTGLLDYHRGELIPALNEKGEAREPGLNEAGVVIGVQTDYLGLPSPARRLLILGDLTHESRGSLSAQECTRINAAIRYAAREGIPVDWITASSGAEISPNRGVENLDATASTAREIILNAHSLGVPINVVVDDVNIGAQSYWNSLAAIIHNTSGILIMTSRGSMALTGPEAWTAAMLRDLHSEDLPARSRKLYPDGLRSLAGYPVHGPNGEAMMHAASLSEALELLLTHHYYSYRPSGLGIVPLRVLGFQDPEDRDITLAPSAKGRTVGQEIADILGGRQGQREAILEALRDQGSPAPLPLWRDAEGIRHQDRGNGLMPQRFGSLIQEMQMGGRPTMVIFPPLGPLTPADSEIIGRAIMKANRRQPVLILGSLSGFNGDPRSMENRQLFGGATLAEAIVRHEGPITVVNMGYIVGGTFVVVSKQLSNDLHMLALEGSHAQVIGGPSAAKVVFRSRIRRAVDRDPRMIAARQTAGRESSPEALAALEEVRRDLISESERAEAQAFDRIHSVDRALKVGAVDEIIPASQLRGAIIRHQESGIRAYLQRREAESSPAALLRPWLQQSASERMPQLIAALEQSLGSAGARAAAQELMEGLRNYLATPEEGPEGGSSGEGGPENPP